MKGTACAAVGCGRGYRRRRRRVGRIVGLEARIWRHNVRRLRPGVGIGRHVEELIRRFPIAFGVGGAGITRPRLTCGPEKTGPPLGWSVMAMLRSIPLGRRAVRTLAPTASPVTVPTNACADRSMPSMLWAGIPLNSPASRPAPNSPVTSLLPSLTRTVDGSTRPGKNTATSAELPLTTSARVDSTRMTGEAEPACSLVAVGEPATDADGTRRPPTSARRATHSHTGRFTDTKPPGDDWSREHGSRAFWSMAA